LPLLDSQNRLVKIAVTLDSHPVFVTAWQVKVGKAKLYLLDTRLEENLPADRELSARLYGGNSEQRLKQEMVLGIGGVRLFRELKVDPVIWHANEGHTAFMMLERCREQVKNGMDFAEALKKVQERTVFTTHTPVPAGNDAFPQALVDKYFAGYYDSLKLSRAQFFWLGTQPGDGANFNMSVLSLKTSGMCNGVSRLHGAVCRRMWHGLWPEVAESNVPILSITNGVHIPTWISPQMANLYSRYLGTDWLLHNDEPALWSKIKAIPAEEIWRSHRWLKIKLINALQQRARENWRQSHCSPVKALAMGALLDSETFTIGFCRRFTDYKRPWLILYDISRLKNILHHEICPVQIIFAGKAHPNDHRGKMLIQQVYNLARDPELGGRITFVEDYDLHLSRYLVQGVDLWLNNPRQLQEASGTSGMKAALNGVPNLSVMDGWWYEAYNGANGWAIGGGTCASTEEQDKKDALDLYALLENTIVPLYYHRDRNGIPQGWIKVIKESIRSIAPLFSARRMLKEYIELMYVPLADPVKQEENFLSSARGSGGIP
jgi:glycogen phosphorylase